MSRARASWATPWGTRRPHHRPTQSRSLRISIGFLSDLLADELPVGREGSEWIPRQQQSIWRRYDACALLEDGARLTELLVDQGTADQFLATQLKPHLLEGACARAGVPLTLRIHESSAAQALGGVFVGALFPQSAVTSRELRTHHKSFRNRGTANSSENVEKGSGGTDAHPQE
jgi:hypothetical protein